ncbi:MAG: helix-turn-helix domain-containing protein [Aminipila sp.]
MDNNFYTVEQISELLCVHVKTIQRYIREGKLQASKIGKCWRISGHDLSKFIESNSVNKGSDNLNNNIIASLVMDISTNGSDDAIRVMNLFASALNSKPSEFSNSSMHTQYIENQNLVRVTMWGDIRFISVIADLATNLTEQKGEENEKKRF